MYTPDPPNFKVDSWTTVYQTSDSGEQIRRNYKVKDELVDRELYNGGNTTLYEVFKKACFKWPDRSTLGRRTLIGIEIENKKIPLPKKKTSQDNGKSSKDAPEQFIVKNWKYSKLSEYKFSTYKSIWEETGDLGRGLASEHLGLARGDTVQIFAPTSAEWLKLAFGCIRQSIRTSTAYDTLGLEALIFSFKEVEAKVLFTRADMLPTAAKVAAKCENMEAIIFYGDGEYDQFDPAVTESVKKAKESIQASGKKLFTYEEVVEFGKKAKLDSPDMENEGDHPPTPDDTALVMYTSGTTGTPKGVVIKHKNICSLIGGMQLSLIGLFDENDMIIAYLPLAHILEFVVELIFFSWGVPLGYGTPRTLTTSMVRNCLGDLEALNPTLMVGVPQVWNGIIRELLNQVKSKGAIVSAMFNAAIKFKWARLQRSSTTSSWTHENILFSKPRKLVGGRLRLVLSGGASIAPETQKLISCILCPMIQGYGLTETCGVIGVQCFRSYSLEKIGPIIGSVECKLHSVPEAGYLTENNQGEIWVRGPSISSGYLKAPEGDESFTEDGWFRTGDVGEWAEDGQLKVIDRIKNLVKMANGEYIALEQLESLYVTSPYVSNLCLHVKSDQNQPIAIVCLNDKLVPRLASQCGLDKGIDMLHLAHEKKAIEAVHNSLLEIAKNNKFLKAQTVMTVLIDENEWTPQNGMLTAASKIQRRSLYNALKGKIDEVYASL
ncbi:hypothetical protein BB560_003208 [Smittium megazygosporum]|uniref:AMP-dependent synthetase/ligase domain-containing protein n=1 Tax=Smittium megazygosporum TaxID=133381 RepID=A0A2T9ZCQ3_9FUNG|nr:hypothetical protein BB560_003208 [Smittium megazygosporum]